MTTSIEVPSTGKAALAERFEQQGHVVAAKDLVLQTKDSPEAN